MTQEEHLNKIVAKCRELLAIADQRTPGKWESGRGTSRSCEITGEKFSAKVTTPDVWYSQNKDDAEFIASCAGPAEAGWRATIAAIEVRKNCLSCGGCGMTAGWVPSYANPDNSGGHPEAEPCCTHIKTIIAAWPEELL